MENILSKTYDMKKLNRRTGELGEQAAAGYLQTKGYQIISRNFRTRFGEIDLICRHKGMLVFVEVKTKKGEDFGIPEEMFTRTKYTKVRRMAEVYLEGKIENCRIDMTAVILDDEEQVEQIRHYENVGGEFEK